MLTKSTTMGSARLKPNNKLMKKLRNSIATLICLVTLVANAQEQPTGVQVSGEATQTVPNNRAAFEITLTARGETPKEAKELLLKKTSALKEVIKGFPDTEKTETTNIVSNPIWVHAPSKAPQINGYTASTTTTTVCPAETAGDLASQIVEINPEQLQGPRFHLSEALRKSKEMDLLKEAVNNAREKAAVLTQASGMNLGNPVFIGTETMWEAGASPMKSMIGTEMAMAMHSTPEPMPTEAGEGKLQARVNVHFELVVKPK